VNAKVFLDSSLCNAAPIQSLITNFGR